MRVLVERDFYSPELEVEDVMVFQCGCACRIEALSHPGADKTLAYHMVSSCETQMLEVGTSYDTEEYDIFAGYESVHLEVVNSHAWDESEQFALEGEAEKYKASFEKEAPSD